MHVIAVGKEQYLLNIAEEIMNKEALTALFEKYVRKLRITPAWDVRLEFVEDPAQPTGLRTLPLTDREIREFSKKRNPMNHPCVMFKKSAVEAVGGYKETYHLFEDYYLWVRMLMNGYKAQNTADILLDMRTPADIYMRRGGKRYAEDMLRFHKWLRSRGWSSTKDYLTGAIPHALVCVLPNGLRKAVYKGLRK